MSIFSITPHSTGLEIKVEEGIEEQDIVDMLSFDESQIEELLKTHAANQAYWEALAVRYKGRYENFKNQWSKKWWAHNKQYAKAVLIGYGNKSKDITKDAIIDNTIIIYSHECSEVERSKYAQIAFKAVKSNISEEEYKEGMFKYINMSPAWYFETVIETLQKLNDDAEIIQSIAEKLNSRSFHMQNLLELVKAKMFNIGPNSISEKSLMESINSKREEK